MIHLTKKKKSHKGKGSHLGGTSLGSTRKDPYNLKNWDPPGSDFKPGKYKPFDFKPVTGVTGKESKTAPMVRFKGPAISWRDRPERKKKGKK